MNEHGNTLDFVCPDGYGRACRNPLCRVMYAIQARELGKRLSKGRPRPDYDPRVDHPERYTDGPI